MTSAPYASARRVFWVVDNGCSHAGRASIERLEGAYENLLGERLIAFGRRYREIARPFEWTFTRADLERVLDRVDAQATQGEPSTSRLRLVT